MTAHPIPDALAELLDQSVSPLGLDVDSVEITPAGKRRVVRVVLDSDDGLTLDQVARATRAITRNLDEDDSAMGAQAYTLEVSSRGVDKPLEEPKHWRRNVRRLVAVTFDDESGTQAIEGRITAADDDGADLDVEGSPVRVSYADVRKARIQVEFNRKED
ncbi:MAG: ribosome maturation factor RimP [Nocardioidaceae bacterium]|nr:ribosome maturation factor RimP [Nocardioidaceae bacterium]